MLFPAGRIGGSTFMPAWMTATGRWRVLCRDRWKLMLAAKISDPSIDPVNPNVIHFMQRPSVRNDEENSPN